VCGTTTWAMPRRYGARPVDFFTLDCIPCDLAAKFFGGLFVCLFCFLFFVFCYPHQPPMSLNPQPNKPMHYFSYIISSFIAA
jgi:hypothetical protein